MSILSLIPVFVAAGLVAPATVACYKVYRRSRGPREVTCPEAGVFATIQLDGCHAVAMEARGDSDARVKRCSLWPTRQDCAQGCVR